MLAAPGKRADNYGQQPVQWLAHGGRLVGQVAINHVSGAAHPAEAVAAHAFLAAASSAVTRSSSSSKRRRNIWASSVIAGSSSSNRATRSPIVACEIPTSPSLKEVVCSP